MQTALKLPALKLKWKILLVLLFLISLILVFTNVLWFFSIESQTRERIFNSEEQTARAAAFRVTNFIQAKVNTLISRSQTSAFLQENLPEANFEFELLLKQDKDFRQVSLINTSGQELIKMTPERIFSASELVNQKDSDMFILVNFRYGLEYVSPVYFADGNVPFITIAVPIVIPEVSGVAEKLSTGRAGGLERSPGDILGVVAVEVSLDDLLSSVAAIELDERAYIFIVDGLGRLIAHPNKGLVTNQFDVSSTAVIKAHKDADAQLLRTTGGHPSETLVTSEGLNESGIHSLATHIHLEGLRWGVVVQQPTDIAFAGIRTVGSFAFGLFLAGLIFTILVSLFLANLVTKGISLLQSGTQVFGSGDLSHRIDLKTNDEIEQLAKAFNEMAENLEKRSVDLEKARVLAEGQKNQINSMFQSIADGILALDFQGRVFKINPAALAILGLEEKDILEKNLDEVITIGEGMEKITTKDLLPAKPLETDAKIFEKQGLRVSSKKETPIFIDLVSSGIKEGREIGLGALITIFDVTKEKEFEEMKLDFVSMAAHELRTPLTSVRGYLSVLLEELRKKLTPEQYSFLDKAFISSTQLAALVENLLSVARIERGSLQIQTQAVQWEPLVEESYNNFLPQAKERKVKLNFVKPSKKLPLVLVDKFRIGEVLSNLVGNALNYTPAGGSVEISLEVNDKEITTHVKDTGQGIPEVAIPKLFEKFFRVSGVLEQGSKGTGLGLYISKAIIDMHRGKIWVESKVGVGSNFSFTVPIAKVQELKKVKIMSPGKRFFMKKKT